LGLACAANVGSAATLIGNPQNMLIGQTLRLSFGGDLVDALLPVGLGLIVTWALVVGLSRGRWRLRVRPSARAGGDNADPFPPFNRWQSAKGITVAVALFAAFLVAPWPRELLALVGAGLLLTSRRLHSHRMQGLVDWLLRVLFAGLFVVNHAFRTTGLPERAMSAFAGTGLELSSPWALFGASFVLSNLVSNVPAVMLLLPVAS
jgi:Na+/H+ antiporter NhaD/arsenite permease-like protein